MKIKVAETLSLIVSRKVDLADVIARLDFTEATAVQASRDHHSLVLDILSYRVAVSRKLANRKAKLINIEHDAAVAAKHQLSMSGDRPTVAAVSAATKASPAYQQASAEIEELEILDEYLKGLLRLLERRLDQIKLSISGQHIDAVLTSRPYGHAPVDTEEVRDRLKKKYPGGS